MSSLNEMFTDPLMAVAFQEAIDGIKSKLADGQEDFAFLGLIAGEFYNADEDQIITLIAMKFAKEIANWDGTMALPVLFAVLMHKEMFKNG